MTRVFAGPCMFALCVLASVSASSQGTFRSGAEGVRIDVQVTEAGRPVIGLTADNFEVRDGGVRQAIDAFALKNAPLSVLLALDASASVNGAALAHLREAARAAVSALREEDEAALLTFAERIELGAPWGVDREGVSAAIAGIDGHGSTALNDALVSSLTLSDQARGRRVAIVFTDGRDTISYLEAKTVLAAALASDVVVYAVSAGPPVIDANRDRRLLGGRSAQDRFDEDPTLYPYALLQRLTEETGGAQIHVDSTRDLAATFAAIVDQFRMRYVLTYTPTGVAKPGWHPLEVKLKGRSGTVRARRGYVR
jgi:Ca-activated chloride channel family protein